MDGSPGADCTAVRTTILRALSFAKGRGALPKESLLRLHEHDRRKESIMIHASLNIHEPKWIVNQFQGQTESYNLWMKARYSLVYHGKKGYAVSHRINRYQDMKLR